MSQTWVIKDTAPVDEASLTLATTNISFTTNNEKATSIDIVQDELIVMLIYGGVDSVAQLDLSVSSSFEWYNDAYKTLEFDTAPTGELLAWLQKNADEQSDPEYLTLKSELTLVANAIRAKGGTTEPLAWPDGFATAISGIETGGGDNAAGVIDKSVTSITSNVAEVGQYAFYGCEHLESASFPEATTICGGAFAGCKALVSISGPKVTEIKYGGG